MSISADSADTAIVTFEKSDGRRIKFEARFLTRKQAKEHRRIRDGLDVAKDDETWWDGIRKMHDIGLIGWELDKPYSFEALDDELTEQEIIDLVCGYPSGVQLTEIEMGKSESRRRFHAGVSAATAPAASATPQP